MHRHAGHTARLRQRFDQAGVADARFITAVNAVDGHRTAHRYRHRAHSDAARHGHIMDGAREQRCHLNVLGPHRAFGIPDVRCDSMGPRHPQRRAAHIVVRQAGAHRDARPAAAQSQGHRASQAVDGGAIVGLHQEVTVGAHRLVGRCFAHFRRNGVGYPVQHRRAAKPDIGSRAADSDRTADGHRRNLRVQSGWQIVGTTESGLQHNIPGRYQRRTQGAGIHRVEHPIDGKSHAGRDAASRRHRDIARQRRYAGRIPRQNTDIARGGADGGIRDAGLHRVLQGVNRQRTANSHTRSAGQADRHVINAGARFGADLHGLRRKLGAADGRLHAIADIGHADRSTDGRRRALRERHAQRARRRHDAAAILRRDRQAARGGIHLSRASRVVDHCLDFSA